MRERLERFSIFEGLGPEELAGFAALCQITTLQQGAQVFRAGEPATSLFLVTAGEIELRFKVSYYNAEVEIPLEKRIPGSVFGWSAVTHPYRYTLSAYAAKDSEVMEMKRADIHRVCEANNRLGYIFMRNTARIIGGRFQVVQAALAKEIQDRLRREDTLA